MELDRVELTTVSPEETQSMGRTLGAHARPGHVLLLFGDLGAGKTCLTQGVLWGLGAHEYARSPTFVFVAQYQARMTMYHIDLYRLGDSGDGNELGLDEYIGGDGLSVVEWADRLPGLSEVDHLGIRIQHLEESARRITLWTAAAGHAPLLDAVRSGQAQV